MYPPRPLPSLLVAIALALLPAYASSKPPFTYLEMRPASSTPLDQKLTRWHYEYTGGCFDLDAPADWKLLKVGEPVTKLGDGTIMSLVVTRWDVAPGESLRDSVLAYYRKDSEWRAERAKKMGAKWDKENLDQGMEFDESRLLPVRMGQPPDDREAMAYTSAFLTLTQKSDWKLVPNVEAVVTTELKGRQILHMDLSALDGATRVMFRFNTDPSLWKLIGPKAEAVINSVRFGNCKKVVTP